MKLFDSTVYTHRRKILQERIHDGLIWISGNELSPKNYKDNPYHFRQDSTFLYYAGIDLPGLFLLMDNRIGKSYLCGREHGIDDTIWTGPQPSLRDWADKVGIDEVLSLSEMQSKLEKTGRDQVHFLPPYRSHSRIRIAETLRWPVGEVENRASVPLIEAVIKQRSVKEERELEEMEEALKISHEMHLAVMSDAKPGMRESELVAVLMKVANQHNVDIAYPVILTVHGETLHNHRHANILKDGDLLLGDFGAESSMHYASDITRTIPVSSRYSPEQEELYQLVLDALGKATELLKPGLAYKEVHLEAALYMANGLKRLGIMQGDPEEAVMNGAHALFFPHGLGHMIGLDVHDMEDLGENRVGYGAGVHRSKQFGLSALRMSRQLEEGFVITVEPGLYFIPDLIDLWKSKGQHAHFINYDALEPYRNLGGIRIEDNYVITGNGSRRLGPPIPKTIDEIEFLRGLDEYIA